MRYSSQLYRCRRNGKNIIQLQLKNTTYFIPGLLMSAGLSFLFLVALLSPYILYYGIQSLTVSVVILFIFVSIIPLGVYLVGNAHQLRVRATITINTGEWRAEYQNPPGVHAGYISLYDILLCVIEVEEHLRDLPLPRLNPKWRGFSVGLASPLFGYEPLFLARSSKGLEYHLKRLPSKMYLLEWHATKEPIQFQSESTAGHSIFFPIDFESVADRMVPISQRNL